MTTSFRHRHRHHHHGRAYHPEQTQMTSPVIVLSKVYLFKSAWKAARIAAVRFGGVPRQYFADALRDAWRDFRETPLAQEGHLVTSSIVTIGKPAETALSTSLLDAASRRQEHLGSIYSKLW